MSGGNPRSLTLDAEPPLGIRRSELIVKDVSPRIVQGDLAGYHSWRDARDAAIREGSRPTIAAQTATEWARMQETRPAPESVLIEVVELPRDDGRPGGIRFGALVHATLASVSLDADAALIQGLAASRARVLGATDEEAAFASRTVQTVLAHPLLDRARQAMQQNACRREAPVTWRGPEGTIVEGVIDLAFKEDLRWTIVDFKTDEELRRLESYRAQVGLYCTALQAATGHATVGILMRI